MPLDRTSCIKLYKNNARSRLFCRIATRSIAGLLQELIAFFTGYKFIVRPWFIHILLKAISLCINAQ